MHQFFRFLIFYLNYAAYLFMILIPLVSISHFSRRHVNRAWPMVDRKINNRGVGDRIFTIRRDRELAGVAKTTHKAQKAQT